MLFVLTVSFVGFSGCASYPVKQDWRHLEGQSLSLKNKVFNLEIVPASGVEVLNESLSRFKEIIVEEMAERNLGVAQGAASQVIVEITKYDEGNAATRFLVSFGLGAVIIETAVSVIDREKEVVVMKGTLGAETSANPFNFSSAYGSVEGVQRKIAKKLAEKLMQKN